MARHPMDAVDHAEQTSPHRLRAHLSDEYRRVVGRQGRGAIGRACPRWTSQDTLRIVGAAVAASEPQVCVIDSSTSLSRRVRRAGANGTDRATALFTAWIRTTSQRCSAIVAEL